MATENASNTYLNDALPACREQSEHKEGDET